MRDKISIKQAFIDYELEQKHELSEAQNYYMLLSSYFNSAIYEDKIIDIVGNYGLTLLRRYGLIESCGIISNRRLYAI